MKKLLLTLTFLSMTSISAFAQEAGISLMGMYGWNETWKSHGGVDVVGFLPVCRYFEATAALEAHSPKVFAATLTARPKYPLPFGELFLDASVHYRCLAAYAVSDFNLAASVGYRFDYLSAQIGMISHWIFDMEKSGSSSSSSISEPLNLLYRLEFNVRPSSSRWNVGGGAANFTDFEYERTWEPMYFLHGHYDLNDSISLLLRADLKPAGAFHLTAQFWGIAFRAGVKYKF